MSTKDSNDLDSQKSIGLLPSSFQNCEIEVQTRGFPTRSFTYDNIRTCLKMMPKVDLGYSLRTLDKGEAYLVSQFTGEVFAKVIFKLKEST